MANYDQSGNPIGNRQPSAPQQGGGRTSGQQAQFSASRGEEQGRGMQQSAGRSPSSVRGSMPDLHSGLGFGGGPFQLISRLSDEMDRLFESFGLGSPAPRGQGQGGMRAQGLRNLWAPHIEVCERNGKLLIQADLPGVRREDVDVQIEDDAVVIQGQRREETERNEEGFYHSERSYGSFYRVVPLPEGADAEQANATFRDGVLQIELALPQQRQRGRRLEIRDAGSAATPFGGSGAGAQGQQAGQGAAAGQQGAGKSYTGAQSTHGQSGQQGAMQSPGGQQQAEGSSERR